MSTRPLLSLLATLLILAPSAALAWTVNGTPVCTAAKVQALPNLCSDGQGGVFVVWQDRRRSSQTELNDVYLLHLQSDGTRWAGWPVNGIPVSETGTTGRASVVPDGAGGVLVVWGEFVPRSVRLQRIDAGGAVHAGWPAGGTTIFTSPYEVIGAAASDAAGGAFVASTMTNNPEIVWLTITHVDSSGAFVAPFNANGVVVGSGEHITGWSLAPDSAGAGIAFAITRFSTGLGGRTDAVVGRVNANGTVVSYTSPDNFVTSARATSGTAGDVFAAWWNSGVRRGQHLDGSGTLWPSPSDLTAVGALARDGAGGVCSVGMTAAGALAVDRRAADGSVPGDWPAGGVTLVPAGTFAGIGALYAQGAIVACWSQSSGATGLDLRAQAIARDGTIAPGWPTAGAAISEATGDQSGFSMIVSGGGALVAWEDDRAGAASRDIYIAPVGPAELVGVPRIAAALAIVNVAPNPARESARVEFRGDAGSPVTVELVDLRGTPVRSAGTTAGAAVALDTRSLRPGVYWVRARRGTVEAAPYKLVVLH